MAHRINYLQYALLFAVFCYFNQPSQAADSWTPINNGLTNTVVNAIAINPSDTQVLYAGTAGGGIFKSTDGGNTWATCNSGLNNLNVTSIVIDPLDSNIIYAATSAVTTGYVAKSTNGGQTWSAILVDTIATAFAAFAVNSETVLLAADGSYIYRKATGTKWVGVYVGSTMAIVMNPINPVIGYAATTDFGVRDTTDTGLSWGFRNYQLPTDFTNTLAIDPITPSTLYCAPAYNGVWKSTDVTSSVEHWYASNQGIPIGANVTSIAIDPTNPQIVYAGIDSYGVYRSTDGGTNWAAYNNGFTNLSISPQAMAIDPKNPATVYVGTNGGGIFRYGATATPQRPADTICYPQLAVGGGYEVVLLIQNNSTSAWKGRAEPLLKDGSLDYLMMDLNLAAGETQKWVLTGGSSTITSGLEIFGDVGNPTSALSIAFFFNYSDNGKLIDTFGVPKGQAAKKFTLPVEEASPVSTGFAIRRLPYKTDSLITLTLRDAQGKEIGSVTRSCDFAMFVYQMFPGLPADFIGSMTIESDTEFFMVVIRMEYQEEGTQFTSCPAEAR